MTAVRRGSREQRGFTLIELMITVAVLAILAAIAYPNYTESLRKTRRGDAQAALLSLANAMERYKTNNIGNQAQRGYTGAAVPAIHPAQAPIDGTTKFYNLAVVTATATAYSLRATPIAGSPQAGDSCGNFLLDQNGTRTHTGSKPLAECWR